jgi:hypothetical protein
VCVFMDAYACVSIYVHVTVCGEHVHMHVCVSVLQEYGVMWTHIYVMQ